MSGEIIASVLGSDYSRLGDEVLSLAAAGVDGIQWDVMDGHFVPNLTFGAEVVASCRGLTALPFEAHLMITEPATWVGAYVEAGCEYVIVHIETDPHVHRTLSLIRELGARPGLALNPSTPAAYLVEVIDLIDLVVVMTVNPGFGGQGYLSSMEPKIGQVRAMIEGSGRPISLEVDGGIKATTIGRAARAGADRFISGSGILTHPGGRQTAVTELKQNIPASVSPDLPGGVRIA
ncbi:MAG: ribulose-phosphate 3-epimerase [Acidimicrobiia bacterium]|nr:ribulose-phosphate 3-epimerase [Acidimicrobiia bacterium]